MTSPVPTGHKDQFSGLTLGVEDIDYANVQPWVVSPGANPDKTIDVGPFQFDVNEFISKACCHSLTRPLTMEEKSALEGSIRQDRVREAVCVDPSGRIVDGFHRVRICCELLLKEDLPFAIPFKIVKFDSETREAEFVATQHASRRQLSTKDRKEMAKTLLKSGHEGTDGALATLMILSKNTVQAIREALEDAQEIPELVMRRDIRGSYHPRKDRVMSTATSDMQAEKNEDHSDQSNTMGPDNEATRSTEANIAEDDHISSDSNQELDGEVVAGSTLHAEAHQQDHDSVEESQHAGSNQQERSNEDEPYATGYGESKPIYNPSPSEDVSHGNSLLDVWWENFGVEPISSTELHHAMVCSNLTASDEIATKSVLCSLGKKLTKMDSNVVDGYFVQSRVVSACRFYFIRPATWTKHGNIQ